MSADQTKACKALLANVVLLAIADATSEPIHKKIKPGAGVSTDQYTAMRFLFGDREAGVDAYAHWLDFNVDQFRNRLRTIMADNSAVHVNGYSPLQRRNFRFNFAQWLANQTLELPEELNDD